MPQGTVQAKGQSQSGKPQVTVDGQKYSTGNTDIGSMQVGDRIEFESTSSVYNGRTVWFLNAWKLLEGVKRYPSPNQPQVPIAAPAAPQAPQVAQVTPSVSDGERLTISNWVAAAIQAGLIKDAVDMGIWAASACQAIRFAGTTWPKNTLGERLEKFLESGVDPNEKIPF